MFSKCNNLKDIKPLENSNVSNGANFSYMFQAPFTVGMNNEVGKAYSSLYDFTSLKNWNLSKGTNFSGMFSRCLIDDITPLENWNVSNGTDFSGMFSYCYYKLKDRKPLEKWNSNKKF